MTHSSRSSPQDEAKDAPTAPKSSGSALNTTSKDKEDASDDAPPAPPPPPADAAVKDESVGVGTLAVKPEGEEAGGLPAALDDAEAAAEAKDEAVAEVKEEVTEEVAADGQESMDVDTKSSVAVGDAGDQKPSAEGASGGGDKPVFMDIASLEAEMDAAAASQVPANPTILLVGKNTQQEKVRRKGGDIHHALVEGKNQLLTYLCVCVCVT